LLFLWRLFNRFYYFFNFLLDNLNHFLCQAACFFFVEFVQFITAFLCAAPASRESAASLFACLFVKLSLSDLSSKLLCGSLLLCSLLLRSPLRSSLLLCSLLSSGLLLSGLLFSSLLLSSPLSSGLLLSSSLLLCSLDL
jgi:hypothetical protein